MSRENDLRRLGGCKPKTPKERFFLSIEVDRITNCWMWLGADRGSMCYGAIKVSGRPIPAHRYSYQINVGEIPEGMLVLHKCDTPKCVNPDHLFLGTHQDNMKDCVKKGRQARGALLAEAQYDHRPVGERNGLSKLTEEAVWEIRHSPLSQRKIASRYGVSQTSIHNILARKTWRHI